MRLFAPQYDPSTGIYGMDFFICMTRPVRDSRASVPVGASSARAASAERRAAVHWHCLASCSQDLSRQHLRWWQRSRLRALARLGP